MEIDPSKDRITAQPVVIGYPHRASGRGEDARAALLSLVAAGYDARILDLHSLHTHHDAEYFRIFENRLTDRLSDSFNLFFLNGTEVDAGLKSLRDRWLPSACHIVYPAWELSRYPVEWGRQLDVFDEIWTHSAFTADALSPSVSRPCLAMPPAAQPLLRSFYGRRHFGIRESAFIFLFLFDVRSYVERKNPFAVVDAFNRLCRRHRWTDIGLVIKYTDSHGAPAVLDELTERAGEFQDRVRMIHSLLTNDEIKSLIRCCDCFLSLHRSEGFGRGLVEAMYFGKPVIATAYSGNMEFISGEVACPVDYRLIPVPEGAYPAWEDQVWAEPDMDQAVRYMERLAGDREYARTLGRQASLFARRRFSYLAAGMRFRARFEQLASERINSDCSYPPASE